MKATGIVRRIDDLGRVVMDNGSDHTEHEADCPFNKNGLNVADLLNFFGNNHGF